MSSVFDIELRSPETGQKKFTTVSDVADVDEARAIVEQHERDLVAFSMDIPERDYWESPPGTRDDEEHGLVDLSRWDAYDPEWRAHASGLSYDEAKRANERRLADYLGRLDFAPNGKVRSRQIGRHTTARLLAHRQQEPFEIVSIDQIAQAEITRQQLVREFAGAIAKYDPMVDPGNWEKVIQEIRQKGYPTAAVTAQIHGVGVLAQDNGGTPIVWASDTIKTALHTAYTADPDTHDFFNDVSASEITGTGYTAGGATLGTKTSTYDTTSDQTRLDAADTTWTTSTLSATDAVIYKSTGTASTSPIYGSVDFGATVSTTAGTFQITWDSTGIVVRDYT